jgi:hypothetical protein
VSIGKDDKIMVLGDKISEVSNYIDQIDYRLSNNLVAEDQIEHLNFVKSDQIKILSILNSILMDTQDL